MSIQHTIDEGNLCCVFEGSLDTAACATIHEEMDVLFELIEQKPERSIVFDLKEVDYVASSFLRLCGKAAQRVGHTHFDVINIQPSVKKVFRIAGLDSCVNIH